jgi:hypothetical protein
VNPELLKKKKKEKQVVMGYKRLEALLSDLPNNV